MIRFSHAMALGLSILGLTACGPAPHRVPPAATSSSPPPESLSRIVDRYWDERAAPGSAPSAQVLADSLALERRYLAEVLAVPRASLDPAARLTYDIFERRRELAIEAFSYPDELLPLNPFEGPPEQLARAAADARQRPLRTPQEVEVWLQRIDDYVRWTGQAMANMREGMRRGYTMPRAITERCLPLLQALSEDSSISMFSLTDPQTVSDPEVVRSRVRLASAVKDKLLPAGRQLRDFVRGEYLPRSRTSVALSALPLGPSWYAFRVKRATGSLSTPEEIHRLGTVEVDRLRGRLQLLESARPAETGDLRAGYDALKEQALAAMPNLFSSLPPADFEIRAGVPGYQPAAPDGGSPAAVYVNMAASAARPAAVDVASFLRDGIPGRHYQRALQQQRTDLPKFRRFGDDPAFIDGWALYTVSLGEELGLYRDDAAKRGALLVQLKCAAALVADTGLHGRGWTRAQAVDYLRVQVGADEADAELLTDRFIAMPGDALACMMGEIKIQSLRSRAQQLLGPRFDIRNFHDEILEDGSMPMDVLEARLKPWMEARR
jgi:uncharacterized protein (DUF885 family)